MLKKCTKCGKKKALGAFYTNNKAKDKLTYRCKGCKSIYNKTFLKKYLSNPKTKTLYKKLKRNWELKSLYGITLKDYNILLKKQNNKCAICPTKYTKNKILCVDHNHKTGKVRGLLCHDCNKGLGLFKDRLQITRKVVLYLEKHKGK
jgi:hypothetical protein